MANENVSEDDQSGGVFDWTKPPRICPVSDPVTGVICMLDEGHDGPHDAVYPKVRWSA